MPSIVITGAGSGIGRATARVFLDAGWRVGLIGRREQPLNETARGHDLASVHVCDVTDARAVDETFSQIAEAWGRLDAVFNNAGLGLAAATPDEIDVGDWRRVIEVNLTGSFIVARAAFRVMREQKPQGGRIINNGSISAHAPRPGSAPYTASKHAITGLTKSLSLDGRRFGIAAGQIDIGNAETEMVARMKDGIEQADGRIAAEAVMDVDDVARAVLHMASLPPGSNVLSMTIMATRMPFVGRG